MNIEQTLLEAEVRIANNVYGNYFFKVPGDDRQVYASEAAIRTGGPSVFRTVLNGWNVKIDVPTRTEKGWQTNLVLPPTDNPGLTVRQPRPQPLSLTKLGSVRIRIDALGRLYALDEAGQDPITPHVESNKFQAFYAGYMPRKDIKSFDFTLPESSSERVVVLLRGKDKWPYGIRQDGHYDQFVLGSYVATVEAGHAVIYCLGRRYQPVNEWGGEHWIVLERRFECQFESEKIQCSTDLMPYIQTSGLSRDNDGFLYGIWTGLRYLRDNALADKIGRCLEGDGFQVLLQDFFPPRFFKARA